MSSVAKTFDEVLKFNPYHDSRGRFASAKGAASFTYAPGKSKAHDNAIAREKERQATAGAATGGKRINGIELDQVLYEPHKEAFNNLTANEQKAIRRYMSSTGINENYKYKDLLDGAVNTTSLPVNATLTRGVTDMPTTMSEAKKMIGQEIGTTIKGKPISTSIRNIQNWGSSTISIKADAGTKGMYVDVARQSKKADAARAKAAKEGQLAGEAEFLMPSTTKFKITGVRMGSFKGNDKIIYDAEIIEQ